MTIELSDFAKHTYIGYMGNTHTLDYTNFRLRSKLLFVLLFLFYATTDETDAYVLQMFFSFFFRPPQKYQTTVLGNG